MNVSEQPVKEEKRWWISYWVAPFKAEKVWEEDKWEQNKRKEERVRAALGNILLPLFHASFLQLCFLRWLHAVYCYCCRTSWWQSRDVSSRMYWIYPKWRATGEQKWKRKGGWKTTWLGSACGKKEWKKALRIIEAGCFSRKAERRKWLYVRICNCVKAAMFCLLKLHRLFALQKRLRVHTSTCQHLHIEQNINSCPCLQNTQEGK